MMTRGELALALSVALLALERISSAEETSLRREGHSANEKPHVRTVAADALDSIAAVLGTEKG